MGHVLCILTKWIYHYTLFFESDDDWRMVHNGQPTTWEKPWGVYPVEWLVWVRVGVHEIPFPPLPLDDRGRWFISQSVVFLYSIPFFFCTILKNQYITSYHTLLLVHFYHLRRRNLEVATKIRARWKVSGSKNWNELLQHWVSFTLQVSLLFIQRTVFPHLIRFHCINKML